MDYLTVVNFDRFQQYKDRAPKWIKLHNLLLEDYEFSLLSDSAKWHLIGIWLLASRTDNQFPFDEPWIRRKIQAKKRINLKELIGYGFLQTIRTEPYESVQECTQSREEKSREEKTPPTPQGGVYPPGFALCWTEFPHYASRSKKPASLKVWAKQKLEPIAEQVHDWIKYAKREHEWTKDGGQFVPGFQAWIRDRDFSEPPPKTPPGQPVPFKNRLLTPEEKAERERKRQERRARFQNPA